MSQAPKRPWSFGIGWLTGVAVLTIIAVNVAGAWGIAVARRSAIENAERLFVIETATQAKSLERMLASTRADLAFLAGSPALTQVNSPLAFGSRQDSKQRAAEGSLLIFMRGHPEVSRLVLRSRTGVTVVTGVRRGGLPVVWWTSPLNSSLELEDEPRTEMRAVFPLSAGLQVRGAESARLEAAVDAAGLLVAATQPTESDRICNLDEVHRIEAMTDPSNPPDGPSAVVPLDVESWTVDAPWSLSCRSRQAASLAGLEPLAARYRLTLILNVGVMLLAALLGGFAIVQTRRRIRLEAHARENERVRTLEQQLHHAERLGTVGRLAAGIAHEINNPLEGMSNYLYLAREALAQGDVSTARERVEAAREGLEAAAGIVHRVLAHADPTAPAAAALDLQPVVERSLRWVQSRNEFDKIVFTSRCAGGTLIALGNEIQLGQVFLNLLLNACEMQPDGGEVLIEGRREGERIRLEFADRGPGIAEEDRMKVFEPFYSTRESTGLGLSVSYSIIQQHGGELGVRSRSGGGAVFVVELPAAKSADE